MPPELYPAGPLTALPDRPHSHAFIAPTPAGWTQVALMEWELTAESWSDEHPHDEYNYVLDGLLLVTCDGQTVEVPAGSVVRVPAGTTGHYAAPTHARMLAIYGPNPQGRPSAVHGLSRLTGEGTRPRPGAPRRDGSASR
jgi:mannose-6-phosphate isomerase-like protein (cupin superfamily)